MKGTMIVKSQKRIFGVLFGFMLAASIMLIIGLVYIFSGSGKNLREMEMKYNAAVQDWQSSHRDEFAIGFIVSVNGGGARVMISDQDSPDAITGRDGVKLDSYQPLKYYLPLSTVIPSQPWTSGKSITLLVSPNIAGPITSIYETVPIMTVTPLKLNCTFATCFSDCRDNGGIWNPSTQQCNINKVISNLCMKALGKGSTWADSDLYGGIGCGADNYWNASTYVVVATVPVGNLTFPGNFTLRSIYDPYIVAAYLTQGTFEISGSAPKVLTTGVVLSVLGTSLILIAIVLTFGACQFYHRKYFSSSYRPINKFAI